MEGHRPLEELLSDTWCHLASENPLEMSRTNRQLGLLYLNHFFVGDYKVLKVI